MLDRLGGRENVIRCLTVTVVIGILVWIVTEAASYVAIFGIVQRTLPSFTNWFAWTQIVSRVAYDVWLGSLALVLLLWLIERLAGSPSPPPEHD